jgi:cellobiose phosphorylase
MLLGKLQVSTPDEHTDRMVNIWNAYQCMVTFNMSRSASYFESGIGRGMGFRDSNQDLLGFVHMIPERARERILDIGRNTAQGRRRVPSIPAADQTRQQRRGLRLQRRPAWLVLGRGRLYQGKRRLVHSRRTVQYENEPGTESPLYEHLQRSIQYTLDRLGPTTFRSSAAPTGTTA